MAKEGGRSIGSIGSSAGISRGGFGSGERGGVTTGFSSRGLSAFRGAEGPKMSAIGTPGPSLSAVGVEKPSLPFGSADKPTLSFSGEKFASSKNTLGKTAEKSVASSFGKPKADASVEISENTPKAKTNSIEVSSVIPQPKKDAIVLDLPAFSPKAEPATPKGLVTRDNLDKAVPFKVAGAEYQQKAAEEAAPLQLKEVIQQSTVDKNVTELPDFQPSSPNSQATEAAVKEPVVHVKPLEQPNQSPKVDLKKHNNSIQKSDVLPPDFQPEQPAAQLGDLVTKEKVASAKPLELSSQPPRVDETVATAAVNKAPEPEHSDAHMADRGLQNELTTKHVEDIASKIPDFQEQIPAVQKAEITKLVEDINEPKAVTEQDNVKAEHYPEKEDQDLIIAAKVLELVDDEKKKKELQTEEQKQVQVVAEKYVLAGLAADITEGIRMTEEYLQKDAAVRESDAPVNVDALVAKAAADQTTDAVQLPENKDVEERTVQVGGSVGVFPATSVQPQQKPIDPNFDNDDNLPPDKELVPVDIDKREQTDIIHIDDDPPEDDLPPVDLDETPEKKEEAEDAGEIGFKVDEIAERNRLNEWDDAVRQVFPAFDWDYQAPLNAVASALKAPNSSTNSTLIYQVGKRVDGSNQSSEDWRTPLLTSNTVVNATQARITGMHEILDKPPVVMKSSGRSVTSRDVERVMAGDDTKGSEL
jgi:hypothetical protein